MYFKYNGVEYMSNKFKEYGFKIKILEELNCTGFKSETQNNEKYIYTKVFDIDNNKKITFNIIPNDQPKWTCEKITYDLNIFNEIMNHKIANHEDFINSRKSKFDYSMQELGYTIDSYMKVNRWAYVESKEDALDEILFQYSNLFE
jgi:hypothetical protein